MDTLVERLTAVRTAIAEAAGRAGRKDGEIELVAVSKTHPPDPRPPADHGTARHPQPGGVKMTSPASPPPAAPRYAPPGRLTPARRPPAGDAPLAGRRVAAVRPTVSAPATGHPAAVGPPAPGVSASGRRPGGSGSRRCGGAASGMPPRSRGFRGGGALGRSSRRVVGTAAVSASRNAAAPASGAGR